MQPLFRPFRALGYISDDVPFAVQRRGKETFVTLGVGKAWQASDNSAKARTATYTHTSQQRCIDIGVCLLQAWSQACRASGVPCAAVAGTVESNRYLQNLLLTSCARAAAGAQCQGPGLPWRSDFCCRWT